MRILVCREDVCVASVLFLRPSLVGSRWVYTRDFENLSVTVDFEAKTSSIVQK